MRRVVILTVALIFILTGCASVPISPVVEPAPMEDNFVSTGIGVNVVYDYGFSYFSPESEPVVMPTFSGYSVTRISLPLGVEVRGGLGMAWPISIYGMAGMAVRIMRKGPIDLNIACDLSYSSLEDANSDSSFVGKLETYSIILVPNAEINFGTASLLKAKLYIGPFLTLNPTKIDYVSDGVPGEDSYFYVNGGVHLAGVFRFFRVLGIHIGTSVSFSDLNWSNDASDVLEYLSPYGYLSIGF